MKHREYWAAILFLVAIVTGTVLLFSGLLDTNPVCVGYTFPERTGLVRHLRMAEGRLPPARRGEARLEEGPQVAETVQKLIAGAETSLNRLLDRDHLFIELYGGVQRLSQRQVLDDADPRYSVVRLTDGTLTFVSSEPRDTDSNGRAMVRLRDQLAQREIPLLYVQAPQKLQENDPRLPEGVVDCGNQYADQILGVLNEEKVDYLDLRETFADTGEDWTSWFFKTDHHWTPEAGFTASQTLLNFLQSRYGYPMQARFLDPDRFIKTTYEDWFLGSQGKRVGTLYGGVDSIDLWVPDFYTNFTYSVPFYEIEREGPFEESLLFQERVEKRDYYNGNPYTLYAGGDYPMGRIYNHSMPTGPRVMLLRDSYACVTAPFLALGCGELITVDMRHFHDRLMEYVDWLQPDIVLVMYTAGSVGQDQLFQFFQDPAAAPFYEERRSNGPIADKPLPGQSAEPS